uniref:Receptor ligand binding region domain-containing protein n=1 Tax=Leptobrachium leishanense TaxID=445787 RepID=A0A8C5LGY2_9ANUR
HYTDTHSTLPNDRIQAEAIGKLLRHFGWTWIGIIASGDDNGETQSRELKRLAALYGICIEFSVKTAPDKGKNRLDIVERNINILKGSTAVIVVLCGSVSSLSLHGPEYENGLIYNKTLIIPASFHAQLDVRKGGHLHLYNGSLVLTRPAKYISHLRKYLETVSVSSRPNDLLLEEMKAMHFNCLSSNSDMNDKYNYIGHRLHNCSRDDRLSDLFTQFTYSTTVFRTTYHVYKAVYAMAQSLHEMQLYAFPLNLDKKHKLQV